MMVPDTPRAVAGTSLSRKDVSAAIAKSRLRELRPNAPGFPGVLPQNAPLSGPEDDNRYSSGKPCQAHGMHLFMVRGLYRSRHEKEEALR
jgi:hypothetical protein